MLVADDEPMVCAHLRTILGAAGGLEVVATASDGAEAVEAVVLHSPDVVLMDLRMPGVDGIAATARIAALPDPPPVVALTTFDGDEHVHRALGPPATCSSRRRPTIWSRWSGWQRPATPCSPARRRAGSSTGRATSTPPDAARKPGWLR